MGSELLEQKAVVVPLSRSERLMESLEAGVLVGGTCMVTQYVSYFGSEPLDFKTGLAIACCIAVPSYFLGDRTRSQYQG